MAERAPERIETARLLLTRAAPADHDALCAVYADPAVMRYIERGGRAPEKVRARLAALDAQWDEHGYGYWVLRERSSGALAGAAMLMRDDAGEVEAGYLLDVPFWGRGLATEAMAALVDVAFATLFLPSLFAQVEPANGPSVRVLARLGFLRAGTGTGRNGAPVDRYLLARPLLR